MIRRARGRQVYRSRRNQCVRLALDQAGTHFHDLRHAGNHLVADAGANLRELMERMGHSSSRAALIYLHSTPDRQRALADAVAEQTRQDLAGISHGTYVAREGQPDASGNGTADARSPPELDI